MAPGPFGDVAAKCKNTVEFFKKELGKIRTGRASPSALESVMVDYYGSRVPLNQMGMVSAPEPRMLTVQVYDASAVESVMKAIQSAGLGLNPGNDGALVRIPIPAASEERRKEFVKTLHELAESQRVAIRNHRREANEIVKKMEKDGGSKDQAKRDMDAIQKIHDAAIKELDALMAAKEKEILSV